MPDVVRPCLLPKGVYVMPLPMWIDRVYYPRAVMSCHARRCRPCVLSKGSDVMPLPTSSDSVYSLRAVMSCHARRCRPCVLCNGIDVMPHSMLPTVCAVQGR